jgi:pimeloyl-ACP methyl ester carboxylesterase
MKDRRKIIFIHGALSDGRIWLEHETFFNFSFDVFCPTLPGFNLATEKDFSIKQQSHFLHQYINSFSDPENITVVAWSYGADVIVDMINSRFPINCKYILYEPGCSWILPSKEFSEWAEDASNAFSNVFSLFSDGKLDSAIAEILNQTSSNERYFETLEESVKSRYISKKFTLIKQLHQHIGKVDFPSTSNFSDLDISIYYGQKTRKMFQIPSKFLAEHTINGFAFEVNGAGHMFPLDSPNLFCKFLYSSI